MPAVNSMHNMCTLQCLVYRKHSASTAPASVVSIVADRGRRRAKEGAVLLLREERG